MNYITTQGLDTITEDKIEIKRMVYTFEYIDDSYRVIKENIYTLDENIGTSNTYIEEVENLFNFVAVNISNFIRDNNLPTNKLGHINVYMDLVENPKSNTTIVKSIDIYEDDDERYMDKEIDRLFENMDNMIKQDYASIIKSNFDIDDIKDRKEYNKNLMSDIIKQKGDELNNGGVEISKLSAILKLEDKNRDSIRKVMKAVANLKIKPKVVNINEEIAILTYACKKSYIVRNIEAYSSILLDFVDYINNIEEIDLYLDDSTLYGDYKVDSDVDDIDRVKFTSENFSSRLTLFKGHIGTDIIKLAL